MENRRAVVLLSGGIDSSTTLAIAKAEGREIYAMSFNYMQRHRVELRSARAVADAVGVREHIIVDIDLRCIGGSALTSDLEVPKRADTDNYTSPVAIAIPVTYVPARNTIFLSFALAWAEVLNAEEIFIGANAIDYSGYPDCRPEYLQAFEKMANLATKASVEGILKYKIMAPLVMLKKSEIIKKGIELGLDYSLTWSCYDPQSIGNRESLEINSINYTPCGMCDSCRLRQKGFEEAGIKDPLLKK